MFSNCPKVNASVLTPIPLLAKSFTFACASGDKYLKLGKKFLGLIFLPGLYSIKGTSIPYFLP